jgi:hypothetical protein
MEAAKTLVGTGRAGGPSEQSEAQSGDVVDIPDGPVDDGTNHAPLQGGHGEHVAPHGSVGTALGVDDYHSAR